MIGKLGGMAQGPDEPYELKGDPLGMKLADFKQKYARFTQDARQDLPICSDQPGYIGKADLHGEAWHRRAGIIHARVDIPLEDNSPTVAGVKTDLLLYQFVDGQLFRITALFATDLFHVVSEAVVQKYGPPTREIKQPRETDLGEQRLADHPHARHGPPADRLLARTWYTKSCWRSSNRGLRGRRKIFDAGDAHRRLMLGIGGQAVAIPFEHFARFEVERGSAGGRPLAAGPGEDCRGGPQVAHRFDLFHAAACHGLEGDRDAPPSRSAGHSPDRGPAGRRLESRTTSSGGRAVCR